MKQLLTVACNSTWSALSQAEIFIEKIHSQFPAFEIHIVPTELAKPATDFVIRKLDQIHDLSDARYAVIEKGICNNIVIFNSDIELKIQTGNEINIAIPFSENKKAIDFFLQKALPKTINSTIKIKFVEIDNNENILLNGMDEFKLDGITLPLFYLNNLLRYEPSKKVITEFLSNKKTMVLPLFECTPKAGQSVVVIEALSTDISHIEIIEALNSVQLKKSLQQELLTNETYINQSKELGVLHIDLISTSFTYASGTDKNNEIFTHWDFKIDLDITNKELFASTDFMKDFFDYQLLENIEIDKKVEAVFIAIHKAVHSNELLGQIKQKKVWAAGTRTWYELAKKGIWVNGCADGLGLLYLLPLFESPLIGLEKEKIQIVTNTSSCQHWQADGWKAVGTYVLIDSHSDIIKEKVENADAIFWSSFQQYEAYKTFTKQKVVHLSPAGKTSKLLMAAGLQPIVFPTIKAFMDWRKTSSKTIVY